MCRAPGETDSWTGGGHPAVVGTYGGGGGRGCGQQGWTRVFLVVYLLLCCAVIGASGCGGLIRPGLPADNGVLSGTISSPNYPANYPNDAFCVWMFEMDIRYHVALTIGPIAGENATGSNDNGTVCNDYVEVRDGHASATLRLFACHTSSSVTITSDARWLWLKFVSDKQNTNVGFSATWRTVFNSSMSVLLTSPVPVCKTPMYLCPNLECISWSYACDTQNDCGCLISGCDEIGCSGLQMPVLTRVAIGVAVGTGVFLILFIVIGGYEAYVYSKAESDRIKEHAPKRALYQMKPAQHTARSEGEQAQAGGPTVPKHPSYEEKIPVIKAIDSEEEAS